MWTNFRIPIPFKWKSSRYCFHPTTAMIRVSGYAVMMLKAYTDSQGHLSATFSISNRCSPSPSRSSLNLNYRSTPQILRACQNLIRHNEKQIQKALETRNPDGDDVIVLESSSEETEALTVVNEIREMVEKGNSITGTLLFYTGRTFRAVILKKPSSSTRSRITSQTASASMIERRSRFCWIISESYQIPTAMTETMPWSIS